jgi:hypothetical protein
VEDFISLLLFVAIVGEFKHKGNRMEEKDFWAKHNIGTRISLVTFILIYAVVAIYAMMFGVKANDSVYTNILSTVSYIAFLGFAVVTLGVNGVKIVMDGIAKIKGK